MCKIKHIHELRLGDVCYRTDGTKVYYYGYKMFNGEGCFIVSEFPDGYWDDNMAHLANCTIETEIYDDCKRNIPDIIKAKAEIEFLKDQITLLTERRNDLLEQVSNPDLKGDLFKLLDNKVRYVVRYRGFCKTCKDTFEIDIFKIGNRGICAVNTTNPDSENIKEEMAFITLWLDNKGYKWSLVSPHNSFDDGTKEGTSAYFFEREDRIVFFDEWNDAMCWVRDYIDRHCKDITRSRYNTKKAVDLLKYYEVSLPVKLKDTYIEDLLREIEIEKNKISKPIKLAENLENITDLENELNIIKNL